MERIHSGSPLAYVTVLGFGYSKLERGRFVVARAHLFQFSGASAIIIIVDIIIIASFLLTAG
jgi:hypothetical protein